MTAAFDPASVVKASGLDIDIPVTAYAIMEGEALLAVYGLAWGGGKCWVWFHVEQYRPGYGVRVAKIAKKLFRQAAQLGEARIYTPRDAHHETSERLLKALRFTPDYEANGMEIWSREVP